MVDDLVSYGADVTKQTLDEAVTPRGYFASHETSRRDCLGDCPSKITSLHRAAFFSNELVAEALIKHGASSSICVQDSQGRTPIHHAVKNNNHVFLEMALLKCPDEAAKALFVLDQGNNSPYQLAAVYGNVKAARIISAFMDQHTPDEICSHASVQPSILAVAALSARNTIGTYFELVPLLVSDGAVNWNPPVGQLKAKCNSRVFCERKGILFIDAVQRGLDLMAEKQAKARAASEMKQFRPVPTVQEWLQVTRPKRKNKKNTKQ
jgi:ankyrin repeat protein